MLFSDICIKIVSSKNMRKHTSVESKSVMCRCLLFYALMERIHVTLSPPCLCTVHNRVLISWVCYGKPTWSPRHCHWNPLGLVAYALYIHIFSNHWPVSTTNIVLFSEMASLNETNNRVPKKKRTHDVTRQVFKAATTGNAANLHSVLQSMHGR